MNVTANRFPPKKALQLSDPAAKSHQRYWCSLNYDHHKYQEFLQAHVLDLALGFTGIDMKNISTFEELKNDRSRNNRSDTEVE